MKLTVACFSRAATFVDDQNRGAIFEDHLLSALVPHIHCDCFKYFKDLIFIDNNLPAKQQKLSHSKICIHTVFNPPSLLKPSYVLLLSYINEVNVVLYITIVFLLTKHKSRRINYFS